MNQKKSTALVLAQDGIKSLALLPILDFFKSHDHPFEFTVASGAGALVTALHRINLPKDKIQEIVSSVLDRSKIINLTYDKLLKKSFTGLFGSSIEVSAVCENKAVLKIYEDVFGGSLLENIKPALYVQCTDVKTGSGIVLKQGPLKDILYATTNLYPLLAPSMVNGHLLADGTYSDYLPITAALQNGAKKIYAFYAFQFSYGKCESYLEYWINLFHRSYALKQLDYIKQSIVNEALRVELFHLDIHKEISLLDPGFNQEIIATGENLSVKLKNLILNN